MENIINTKEYDFLKTNEHLGNNICLLTLGGSHAYGTNVEGSDIDVRGCALNRKQDILTNENFEQFVNEETDTTIYSFNKLIQLLSNVNPNTIEMLGCREQDYLYLNKIGQELLQNKNMFLSKKAINAFGGYANQQLRRLENKTIRDLDQSKREQHILNTINNMKYYLVDKHEGYNENQLELYIDKSNRENLDTEIYANIHIDKFPLRDHLGLFAELQQVVKSYNKMGVRNSKAIEHGKISKHMMHLVRLYYMCFDILEKEQIITYREKEHDFLMEIRNNKYLSETGEVKKEFFDIVCDLDKRMEYAKNNTNLKEKPNYKLIKDFTYNVNERIVLGNV